MIHTLQSLSARDKQSPRPFLVKCSPLAPLTKVFALYLHFIVRTALKIILANMHVDELLEAFILNKNEENIRRVEIKDQIY